jgi:hypothetical protein
VKYFFLSEGWGIGRVWEFGGLWDENARRHKPYIQHLNLAMVEKGQNLWLHEVEDAVLMVEVFPTKAAENPGPFGQVLLRRLLSGEQVIQCLQKAEKVVKAVDSES